MDPAVCSGSAGQHVELRSLAQTLIEPLKSGLCSFNAVSEILLSVKGDMVLPDCQTFDDIRREIKNLKQRMEESENLANTELQRVDRETETLTAEQSRLTQQKKLKTNELANLNIQLSSHQSILNNYRHAVETARINLQTAETTLRHARDRKHEARRVRLFRQTIKLPHWAVGQHYEEAVDAARQEVRNSESHVNSSYNQVQHYNSLINKTQCDIREADKKICETEAKLRDMSEKRRVVADIQDQMRRVVNQLGRLSGPSSGAERETKDFILLEPVMKVMEEMATRLCEISGNKLLNTEGIQSLIGDIKVNQRKLKELADTMESTNDYDI